MSIKLYGTMDSGLVNTGYYGASPIPVEEYRAHYEKARKELENLGISIVIYPVTTQRLAMFGVEKGLKTIKETGSANAVLDIMQTRSRLYEILNYSGYNNYDKSLYNFKLKKGQ